MSATDVLRRMLDERGVEWESKDVEGISGFHDTRWNAYDVRWCYVEFVGNNYTKLVPSSEFHCTPEQAIAATLGGGTLTVEQVEEAVMNAEHQEPNPDCSAMLYKMFTENMKYEPCKDYEPKDDVSGYGADFNIVEPNFNNLKAVEMDASRLVANEPDSREKLEAEASELVADYAASGEVCDPMYNGIIELLDRQAAITERKATKRHELFCETCEDESDKQIAELTAERDKLQEQLLIGWECECRLQAERDTLQGALDIAVQNESRLTAERERYRSKFGKCLDYADAIHALMDDEGMA